MRSVALLLLFFGIGCGNFRSQSSFYDQNKIQKIEIFFQQPKWDYMMDTAAWGAEGYLMAKILKINGKQYDSVGVKYKGNSSYDSTYLKNPIHIELDAFKDQDHQGFKDIKLSNGYADPSMVREVLGYSILRNFMPAPLSNFAQVYINGIYMGLYSNSESVNKTFCAQHYYSNEGTFVKCNPKLTPSPSVKSNLKFLSGDSSSYFNYYELKSDYGWKSLGALCDSLSNKPTGAPGIINIDRSIWMLAFNALVINLDSYTGAFAQNYYLYKDPSGLFNPIVWDLNMSFGGFPFLGSSNVSLASLSIGNMQTLPVNIHASDPYWPLIKMIFADVSYKKMFMAHLKTMTNEFFANNNYVTMFTAYSSLIDTAVLSDSRKFFTYNNFQNSLNSNFSVGSYSVPGIQTLMAARVSYLQSTADFTVAAPAISQVSNTAPSLNNTVTVTAKVTGANQVYLKFRSAGNQTFARLAMFDDGAHGDGAAGDNVYGAAFTLKGNHAQYYVYAENDNAGAFSPARAEHEFYEVDLYPHPKAGQVVINEFLAYNKSDVKNEFHASEDWVELYNATFQPLSLGNYFLSDDNGKRTRYQFPAGTVIQPESFLIVWADEFLNGKELHSNFKLSENGDQLILSDGLKNVLDSCTFPAQEADVSQARCPDGEGPFKRTILPSFKLFNCLTAIDEKDFAENAISVYPNPTNGILNFRTSDLNSIHLKIYSVAGQLIYETNFSSKHEVDLKDWPQGLYIANCGQETKKIIVSK